MNNLIPPSEPPPQHQHVSGLLFQTHPSFKSSCLEVTLQCCPASTALHTEFLCSCHRWHRCHLEPLLGLNKIPADFILCTQGFIAFLRMTCGSRSCFTAWEQKSQLCFIKNFIYLKTECLFPADSQDQAIKLQIKLFSPLATTAQLSYSDSPRVWVSIYRKCKVLVLIGLRLHTSKQASSYTLLKGRSL